VNVTSSAGVDTTAKAGRIVRVVRIIRLTRIVKLLKLKNNKDEQKDVVQESKTGGRMAEMTSRRVVCIVLFLCSVLPAFDNGYDEPTNTFQQKGLWTLHEASFRTSEPHKNVAMRQMFQV
jgi:hypothetical protein